MILIINSSSFYIEGNTDAYIEGNTDAYIEGNTDAIGSHGAWVLNVDIDAQSKRAHCLQTFVVDDCRAETSD
jgi:hypothetical protein